MGRDDKEGKRKQKTSKDERGKIKKAAMEINCGRSRSRSPSKWLSGTTKQANAIDSLGKQAMKMTTRASSKGLNNNATLRNARSACTGCIVAPSEAKVQNHKLLEAKSRKSTDVMKSKDLNSSENVGKINPKLLAESNLIFADDLPGTSGFKANDQVRHGSGKAKQNFQPSLDEIIITVQASEDDFSSDDDVEREEIYPMESEVPFGAERVGKDDRKVIPRKDKDKSKKLSKDLMNVNIACRHGIEMTKDNHVNLSTGNNAEEVVRPIDIQQIRE